MSASGGEPRRVVGLAVALLLAHAAFYALIQGRHCIDDAYISFRYAANWAGGSGLVFNLGERVDGYTNFGWVALLAGARALRLPLPVVARVLSLVAALAGVVLLGRRRGGGVAAVLLASCAGWARWGQDGMESVAFATLLLAALLAGEGEDREGRAGPAGLLFGLATLLRPDGALWFGAALGLRALLPGRSWRALAVDAGTWALLVLPWAAWRWSYYGYPLPNTFYAKVGDSAAQLVRGERYALRFLLLYLPLVIGAADELIARWRGPDRAARRALVILLGPAALHLAYVAAVGGDWMGPSRFGLPLLGPMALAAGAAARRRRLGWVPILAIAALLAGLSGLGGEVGFARTERRYQDSRAVVGRWLRVYAEPGDRLLTGEIGQLGWESGLHVIDHYGLIHAEIAHEKSADLGRGKAGHEKTNLPWAFEQRPTWVALPFFYPLFDEGRAGGPLEDFELVRVARSLPEGRFTRILHRAGAPTRAPLEVLVAAPKGGGRNSPLDI